MWKKLFIVCILGTISWQWAAAGILPKDSAEQYELTFWNSIRDSNHPEDYESYLQTYPKGRFASLARERIERLRSAPPKAELPPAGTVPPAKPARKRHRTTATLAARPAPARTPAAGQSPAVEHPAVAEGSPDYPQVATVGPLANPAAALPVSIKETRDCATCPTMIELPKGLFTMGNDTGAPTQQPSHSVALGKAFAIGKDEITAAEWKACVDAGACPRVSDDSGAPPTQPVRNVSWDDARRYVQWLSGLTGKPYRLPTEAEWEYAARGASSGRDGRGDEASIGRANCADCGKPSGPDAPAANPYGFRGMGGSVWEWVSDCWHASYKGAPPDGSAWNEPDCRARVIRGGALGEGGGYTPVSTRWKQDAGVRDPQNGLRVARDVR